MTHSHDVVVVGAGLAGLVATAELLAAGRRVVLLDAENAASLGGQAFWSFGGLFLVDSPEQRRLGIKDSAELALADWLGSADFADDGSDRWGRAWAEGFVDFAAGDLRPWLHAQGVRWFPLVQWAERGGYTAGGHGNTVPRFHVTWGTGPGILEPFVRTLLDAYRDGRVDVRFRHRVTALTTTDGRVTGVRGDVLADDRVDRAVPSSRKVVRPFALDAAAVVVATGGIGANHDLVRATWPADAGHLPDRMLSGVPDHVDGSGIAAARDAGGAVVHAGRMWHYPEGIANHSPVWSRHGIRILPGPSSLWLDADGHRLPVPLFPGFDSLGALRHITGRGDDHSWFVLDKTILGAEFALSGSEQNPDLTGRSVPQLLQRVLPGAVGPVETFAQESEEFLWADTPAELARRMNALTGSDRIDGDRLERTIVERDRQVTSGLGKDLQVVATAMARRYVVDKVIRVAKPHRLLDPAHGPLLAVRLSVLTRKTLGGLHTDLEGRVLRPDGEVLPGLWAVGEASGFGGGGAHGHRALEGTFLGGCLFTGRTTGRALASALG
ncbi:FAD-binding dehydrogenase [Cellulomonas fimi]|uniref:Fumarate reductase/succinate dehydrogenase flavoprotein domain protein n=1 Tax=Cellulomonas fimi (strain ATCC 484 / DSM 20113 / JCM 1341 / CCUG 24087 / LMG 16345 / NBRC 15513 / NCIMB 8980 / NCTC 7547 / NRS-133) TaxID=590998 RepID=F4H7C3_CELFA|nr:FAD-binding dehydrogenase [Cellulomonas fimi]AEE46884.1 fumarate reductase/succinate dehydrogenase flavoprotein domain protein [Cellulomonas fimi ATCC 484]NNH06427.1 FAD-binding dehydrogenase [Cellulomonas fimi]VEH34463.1 KsdD-like steroid dehydrogenase MSMEG_5835 [Cellulomonas fimi]